jgi:Fe-S-cluster-containing dehydrogenase component
MSAMKNHTFLIDVEKCTGCMLCSISCKDEHVQNSYAPWAEPQPGTGHFWIDVRAQERGRIPRVRVTYLTVHCQNCEKSPCATVCPDDAIKTRDDGLVWIDPGPCTGCGLCPDACPYDVIFMNKDLEIAQKCTGCAHRVDKGEEPRCSQVCPHDAILFGDLHDIGDDTGGLETLHPEFGAEPRVYWKGLPRPWIAGLVIDAAADEVITGASITSTDLTDDATLSTQSDEFGDFWIKGLEKDRKYQVDIKMDGFEDFRVVVTTDADQDVGTVGLKRTK